MEATALSLARSVLDGVLSSAGSAVADEVARLIGVPKEVDFIRNELEMMRAFLKVSSIHPVPSDTVRTWVKQVRDLAYDVEDCLLDFALYADRASSSRFSSWLPGAVAERHRIAERIRDLKASVVELNQRNQRYHIVVVDGTTPARVGEQQAVVPYQDMLSSELAFQVSDVIGRNHEKTELIELISSSTTTTASSAGLRVVSVWGMGGMGKSSLVRMVHNDAALLDEFDYGAWSPALQVYKAKEYTPLPEDMMEQALNILTRCHGLPLAISTIGGLLANRPKTSISMAYDGLPYHLKPIFLYLGIFPENHEIRRTRLLRRWMAEGYIAKNRDMPMEDVAELFYSELINRSMIQPSKVSLGLVRADRCRVHSIILLQIILPKSIEENQLFIVEKQSSEVPHSKIRHLNLRYLETLDIQDTKVKQLPRGVSNLKKLRYLLAGVNFTKELMQKMGQDSGRNNHIASIFGRGCCKVFNSDWFSVRAPKGIEKLDNLHMLGVIDVGKGHGVAGRNKKLTNLTKLRRLGVTVPVLMEEEGKELCKSISELTRLQRLEVRSDSLDFLHSMDRSRIPKHLVSLRLCGKLERLPQWFDSLNNLAKVKLLGTQLNQEDIVHLENLRCLALVGLWEKSYIGESLVFSIGTFLKLKFLHIDRLDMTQKVTISKGAMPQLEQLWLDKCPSWQDDKDGLSGVPDLQNLKELLLKHCGDKENLINILQEQVNMHSKRPKFLIGKSKMPTRTASDQ
ncbi:hypothetical protein HU200_000752 [Digitaria exilis]|uniref:Rx N-terminal domain-containing protein n=1 Tax=Digitaria exilis TaxID=1010633 RepID=A0A835KW78_9POAL|nr:hypothetical protein HU200_000752 [Digitaria exilis]